MTDNVVDMNRVEGVIGTMRQTIPEGARDGVGSDLPRFVQTCVRQLLQTGLAAEVSETAQWDGATITLRFLLHETYRQRGLEPIPPELITSLESIGMSIELEPGVWHREKASAQFRWHEGINAAFAEVVEKHGLDADKDFDRAWLLVEHIRAFDPEES